MMGGGEYWLALVLCVLGELSSESHRLRESSR